MVPACLHLFLPSSLSLILLSLSLSSLSLFPLSLLSFCPFCPKADPDRRQPLPSRSTTGSHSAAVPHKPTVGEKLSGTAEKLVGKLTSNPAKVAEGEAKATGQPLSGAAAGAHEAVRH